MKRCGIVFSGVTLEGGGCDVTLDRMARYADVCSVV